MKALPVLIMGIGLLYSTGALALSGIVKWDGLACKTEKGWDEANEALAAKDHKWLSQVPGCFVIEQGTEVTVVDVGVFGPTKVHLSPPGGGRPMTLYMHTGSLNIRN